MSKTYTVSQVAEILGYSTNSIYAFLREGRIKGVRVGKGRFRITQEELQRVLHLKKTALFEEPSEGTYEQANTHSFESIAKNKKKIFNIPDSHFDVSSLFDWFIGTGSIVLGFSMLLYSKYLATIEIESYLSWVFPVQLTFILGGLGILLTTFFSTSLQPRWHRLFHLILAINYGMFVLLKINLGDMGGVIIFGFLATVMVINILTKLRGMETFLLFISSFTVGICFLLFLNPLYFDFLEAIQVLEQYYRYIFFLLLVLSVVSVCILWWSHKKRRVLFWIMMIDYGVNFFVFSIFLLGGLSWDKATYLLLTGLTCILVPLWEWIAIFREKSKGKVLIIHLFMLLALTFAIMWIWIMESNIKEYAKKDLQSKVYYASLLVENATRLVELKVSELARNPLIIEALKDNDVAGTTEGLKIAFQGNQNIRRLLIMKENGDLFSIYPYTKLTETNFAFRDYFKIPMQEKSVFISDSFEAKINQKRRVITLSQALRDKDGRAIGVVVASIDLDNLGKRLQELTNSSLGEYILVTDKNKVQILHPDQDLVGTVLNSSNSLISKSTIDTKGLHEGYAYNGKKMLQAFNVVEPLGWYVQVQIPLSTVLAPARSATLTFFLVVTAIVIVQALFVFYLLRQPDT